MSKLLQSQVVRRQEEMHSTGLLPGDQALADLFQEGEQVIPLCGVVIMAHLGHFNGKCAQMHYFDLP